MALKVEGIMVELSDWIGKILLASGGGAAVAFGLFQLLGKNWIKHQFDKTLEQIKSEISLYNEVKIFFLSRKIRCQRHLRNPTIPKA